MATTKVSRYQIIKPINCEWKVLGDILHELKYDTRQILNKSIQHCWEWQGFSAKYKQDHGAFPKVNDIITTYKTIDGYIYNILKDQFPKMNTSNLITTIVKSIQRWKTDLKDVLRGDKSVANFKSDSPINLHNKTISLVRRDGDYYAILSILSTAYRKELNLPSCRIEILLNKGRSSFSKGILDSCIDGTFKISASQIIKKNNKWFLNLSYSFEPTKRAVTKDNILGVYMSTLYPAYMAVNTTHSCSFITGGEIDGFYKQIEKRKKQLQQQGKYCGKSRKGHGILKRIEPIEVYQEKIKNFRDTTNHRYSQYIVDFAVKNCCGIIQLEDMKGISNHDNALKTWPYYDLQEKIKYKAELVGIEVKMIKTIHLAQRCSKCGNIQNEYKFEQETFICSSCGKEIDAYLNAAINTATLDIDNLIEKKLKCES